MSDIFFPADLVPTSMLFGVDDFTAVDESATTGAMQSSTLFGTRRWHLRMDFAVLTGSRLARFEALVAALRGRQNRVWVSPSRAARGSFPDLEMLSNNTFENGTTGWIAFGPQGVISAQDRTLRTKRTLPGNYLGCEQVPTISLSIPYSLRGMYSVINGPILPHLQMASAGNFVDLAFGGNYASLPFIPNGLSTPYVVIYDALPTGGIAGDYFDVPWMSLSRCALVDNGSNLLLWSDDLSNAAWTKIACSITANAAIAADGTTTADALVDTAVNTAHDVQQSCSCGSAVQDITGYATIEPAAKTWVFLQLFTATGTCNMWANLATGVLGTVNSGSGWINPRATIANVGGNKYRLCLTAYKTSADATVTLAVGPAPSDLTAVYTGAATAACNLWRLGIASFCPTATIGAQTSTVGLNPVGQTGTLLRLKGLPPSANGLLLAGDMVEIDLPTNSQLVRVTARLDSDAAGLGVLQFENALKQSPGEGAPVTIQQPMGRFVLAGSTLGVEYTPGVFGQASLEFVEAA